MRGSAILDRIVSLARRLGRRRALQILGGVAVLFAVFLTVGDPGAELPDPVRVRRDELVLSVDIEGVLKAVRAVEVSPPALNDVELKIASLATEGSAVKKGDPVVGFDTDQLRRLLDEKKAEREEAEKRLEQKAIDFSMRRLGLDLRSAQGEADLGRARLKAEVPPELERRIEVEKSALDREGSVRGLRNLTLERQAVDLTANAELRSLGARRDRARSRVAELEQSIERMIVRAPQDSIVILTADWNGEKKKVGDAVWSMQSILSIPDLSEMRALGSVAPFDACRGAFLRTATKGTRRFRNRSPHPPRRRCQVAAVACGRWSCPVTRQRWRRSLPGSGNACSPTSPPRNRTAAREPSAVL